MTENKTLNWHETALSNSEAELFKCRQEVARLKAELKELRGVADEMAKEMGHDVPGECWSTGPLYGDFRDLLCPGCDLLKRHASLSEAKEMNGEK